MRVRTAGSAPFRAWGNRSFRIYLVGSAISLVGTWAQRVAQDFLVLDLGGGGLELGILMAAQFVPVLVLTPLVGPLVDRADRRRILLITQTAAGVLAAVLALLVATGLITLPLLIVLAALLGVSSAFDGPARHTFVADIVGDDDYQSAQSMYSIVHNAGRLGGPAIAALTVQFGGLTTAFALNAVSFIAVIGSLLLIRAPARTHIQDGVPPPADDAPPERGGFSALWATNEIRSLLLGVGAVTLVGQNVRVMLPILVTGALGGTAADYALLLGAMGAGALLGAALPTLLPRDPRYSAWYALFAAVAAVVLALAPVLPVAFAGMVVLGLANSSYNTSSRVGVLTTAPPRLRGRAMSLYEVLFHGAVPVGALVLGVVTQFAGARVAFGVAAAVIAVAVVMLARAAAGGETRKDSSRAQ